MIHARKVLPEYFEALQTGAKTYELRREEPGEATFEIGDYLALNEYVPAKHADEAAKYSGRCLFYEITHVLRGSELLAEGVVALGLRKKPLCWDDVKAMKAAGSFEVK